MKNYVKISLNVISIALCLIFSSCSKKDSSEPAALGKLKIDVGISIAVTDVGSKLKAGVSTANFRVQILNSSNQVVKDYAHASEIPETLELPAGVYHATASSENNQPAAFENPYYFGTSDNFTIVAEQTVTANIPCKLANIMVTVVYSSQVISSFSDYSTKVSNTSNNLVFAKAETRAGFFNAGPLDVEATLTYISGGTTKTRKLTGSIANPQAGKHYEINIDATVTNMGAIIKIVQDENIVKEVVNITEGGSPVTGTPVYGDLLITEIMYDPDYTGEPAGEWFEVYNNSSKTINLKGMVIRRIGSSTNFHQITSDVNMAPASYVVLGRSATATNNVAYVYSSIELTNSGCELTLSTVGTNGSDGVQICSVNYEATGFPDPIGKSIQLDPSIKDVTAAKLGSNWCAATASYSTGDFGTPGVENTKCK